MHDLSLLDSMKLRSGLQFDASLSTTCTAIDLRSKLADKREPLPELPLDIWVQIFQLLGQRYISIHCFYSAQVAHSTVFDSLVMGQADWLAFLVFVAWKHDTDSWMHEFLPYQHTGSDHWNNVSSAKRLWMQSNMSSMLLSLCLHTCTTQKQLILPMEHVGLMLIYIDAAWICQITIETNDCCLSSVLAGPFKTRTSLRNSSGTLQKNIYQFKPWVILIIKSNAAESAPYLAKSHLSCYDILWLLLVWIDPIF